MKPIIVATRTMLAILILALASGCTHINPVTVYSTALPTVGQLLPHRAALVLDQDFSNYKQQFTDHGDMCIRPMGIVLQDYARNVASKSFQQVDAVPSAEQGFALTSADLVLIPRVVKTDCSLPVFSFEKIRQTIVVEWTAKDRASQNTIWLKTITANSEAVVGSIFTGKEQDHILYQKLFDDLSLKTQKAFQEAIEFRGGQH